MENVTWSIALLICTLLVNNNPLADNHLRIFGGYEAKIEDHPWIVSLQYNSSHTCGGSLLNDDTVLTAAHCFRRPHQWSLYSILAGTHDITQPGTKIQVKDVKIHEWYISFLFINDIAIIKLAQKVEFSNKIQPARLPNQDDQLPEGAPILAAGWGLTEVNGTAASDVLKAAKIEVLPHTTCNILKLLRKVICAGNRTNGVYMGDSGGPLEHDGVVVGVASYVIGESMYGGFTSVADYRTWISRTTGI
ncbi:transmembrane protease serine 4 isoform X3 [Diabrotica virgifera virgifera]|uniref:Transmembrane protease serine 4-like n=1 Tax=Diabrotica virgifera virgifera TaxID=50390 RepID=A0A6P7FMK1_DIAVI|nr:transmembrane protease serine 4 isoform X3 [Diabrotica virgifera virgifera]